MGAYRDQEKLDGEILPIIVNVLNFVKPPPGEACLLELRRCAHALSRIWPCAARAFVGRHLSDFAGTNVASDFVEFPSQLYEHWLEQREILRRFARHHRTGAPMPEALIEKIIAARQFNQGFLTVEYTASALVDLALHSAPAADDLDVVAFERDTLARARYANGRRHAPPAAAFHPCLRRRWLFLRLLFLSLVGSARCRRLRRLHRGGRIFAPEVAARLKQHVYSAGNRADPEAAYTAFRGRPASPEPLLKKRGLVEA